MSLNKPLLTHKKSLSERILHALGFEALAIIISAPIASWLMDKPIWQMGALAILLSTTAMLWNIIYNAIFDRLWPATRFKRTLLVRVFHALGFEGGFIGIGLPVVAFWLNISLFDAFMLEIGFFLFFLPYTIAYNWLYDILRLRCLRRSASRRECAAKR